EKLLAVAQDAGFFESFRVADDILRQGVQGISDIITIPGIINRDFADVKAIMQGMGYAVMGTASANGTRRATEAAQKAIASPLLEAGAIDGARGILINITGSTSLKLAEVQEACTIIQSAAPQPPGGNLSEPIRAPDYVPSGAPFLQFACPSGSAGSATFQSPARTDV